LARNANYQAVGEAPQALIYLPLAQRYSADACCTSAPGRRGGDDRGVRREVQPLDPNLRLETETVDRTIRQALWAPRLTAWLLGAFGLLALLLFHHRKSMGWLLLGKPANARDRGAHGARRDARRGATRGDPPVACGWWASAWRAAWASRWRPRGIESLLLATSARDVVTFRAARRRSW